MNKNHFVHFYQWFISRSRALCAVCTPILAFEAAIIDFIAQFFAQSERRLHKVPSEVIEIIAQSNFLTLREKSLEAIDFLAQSKFAQSGYIYKYIYSPPKRGRVSSLIKYSHHVFPFFF